MVGVLIPRRLGGRCDGEPGRNDLLEDRYGPWRVIRSSVSYFSHMHPVFELTRDTIGRA